MDTKRTACPECGEPTRLIWTMRRQLQHTCSDCGWKGKPFTPQKQRIESKRPVETGDGWCYQIFDQRGYTVVYSQSFSSRANATSAARVDIKRWTDATGYGKCTAIIWPPRATLRGTRLRCA